MKFKKFACFTQESVIELAKRGNAYRTQQLMFNLSNIGSFVHVFVE